MKRNLVGKILGKIKIFVQDFVPIRTALMGEKMSKRLGGIKGCKYIYYSLKVAVNTIVPRSPFFLFLYLKTQTVTHIRKKAVEYLRQWNGAICVIYNLCQRQNIS